MNCRFVMDANLSTVWDELPVDNRESLLKSSGISTSLSGVSLSIISDSVGKRKMDNLLDEMSKSTLEVENLSVTFSDGKTRVIPFVVPMRPVPIGDRKIPDKGWIAEEKKDGSLTLQYLYDGAVAYVNRSKRNKTLVYPELTDDEPKKIKTKGMTIIQGEAYALKGGKDSFESFLKRDLLQDRKKAIERKNKYPLKFEAFDIIMKNNKWVSTIPIEERKKILNKTIPSGTDVKIARFSMYPKKFVKDKKKDQTVEGVVLKRIGSRYVSGDRPDWMKVKFTNEADVVVMGYEKGEGKRSEIGKLNVGVWDKKKNEIVEVANVGTGFTDSELASVKKRLDKGEKLFAKVEYLKVGSQGRLRVPSFKGLREDITVKETHL